MTCAALKILRGINETYRPANGISDVLANATDSLVHAITNSRYGGIDSLPSSRHRLPGARFEVSGD